jgi:pimeloyl-ACP methyl ester carboxylesterase
LDRAVHIDPYRLPELSAPGQACRPDVRDAGQVRTMVTSPGGRVHVTSAGSLSDPVVVISSGLGGAWFDWNTTVDLLAPHARVVVFDRPGTGHSGPATSPPSLQREVEVLEAVLHDTERAVLVGHSMATLHVEAFTRLHPDRVSGVVLLDPDPELPGSGRPFDVSALIARGLLRFAPRTLGATVVQNHGHRLRRWVVESSTLGRRDPAPEELVRAVYQRPQVAKAVLDELASYPDQMHSLEALRAKHPLPEVPWRVLTAGRRVWRGHTELAALVPWGRNVLVPGSAHMMPIDRPDAVVMAVRDVLGL